MSTVAIVGGSTLGSAIGHKLAGSGHVRDIRIIDTAPSAVGSALDLQQAGAIESFDTHISGHSELHAAIGSSLVIIAGLADGVDPEYDVDAGLVVLKRLVRLGIDAVTICTGSRHHGLVERGVREVGLSRRRIIGSAPLAYQQALRALVAVELQCSAHDISLTVLGVPPDDLIVPWNEIAVSGIPLALRLPPPRLAALKANARRAWPPATYALASAASHLANRVLSGTGELGSVCTAVLDDEPGLRKRAAVTTAILATSGIVRLVNPPLNAPDHMRLATAVRR